MNKRITEIQNRRDFLKNVGKGSMLGALLFIPGVLITKRRVSAKPEDCDIAIQCRNCGKANNCDLAKKEEELGGQKK